MALQKQPYTASSLAKLITGAESSNTSKQRKVDLCQGRHRQVLSHGGRKPTRHFMPKVKRHTQQISAFDCLLVSLNTLASLLSGAQAMLLSALHSFSCSAVPVVDWKRA
eukprot:scaffold201840_cov17-Tisochrysis_lutea.AAC.1